MIPMERNILSWVDNLRENMNEGPVRFVENRVKTVGTRVKRFCSDMVKDLEESSDEEEINYLPREDSFFKKLYSDVKKELADLIVDDVRVEPQENISRIILNGDCIITPDFENIDGDSDDLLSFKDDVSELDCEEGESNKLCKKEDPLFKEDSLFKKLYLEMMKDISDLVVDNEDKEPVANVNRMILNGDTIITPDFENTNELQSRDDGISQVDFSVDRILEQSQANIHRMFLTTGGGSITTSEFENTTDGDNEVLSGYAPVKQQPDTSGGDVPADMNRMNLNDDSSITTTITSTTTDIENTDDGGNEVQLSRDARVTEPDWSESPAKQDDDHAEMIVGVDVNGSVEQIQRQSEASSVPRESEACESSETTSIEGWNFNGPSIWDYEGEARMESNNTAVVADYFDEEAVVGVYNQQSMMMKLGESCVVVDRLEQVPASDVQCQQQQRSYKKKITDVLYRRRWAKLKKIGVSVSPISEGIEVKGKAAAAAAAATTTNTSTTPGWKSVLQVDESEWELI